jgi:predicted nucleic acid-binding Zn ribbon protein
MPLPFSPPEVCPVCGEAVPRDAKACPGCGADERSGWNEAATRYDGLDLPDAAFDEENVRHSARDRAAHDKFWLLVGVLLLAAMILAFVFR